jgi:ribosomal protein S21
MIVKVQNGNVQRALAQLKRKLQKSGRNAEMARQEAFMRPGEQRRAAHRRSMKRIRKEERNGR